MPTAFATQPVRPAYMPETWANLDNASDHRLRAALRIHDYAFWKADLREAVATVESRMQDVAAVFHATPEPDQRALRNVVVQLDRLAGTRHHLISLRARLASLAGLEPEPAGEPSHVLIDRLLRTHARFHVLADERIRAARVALAAQHERLEFELEQSIENNRGGRYALTPEGPGLTMLTRNVPIADEHGTVSERLDLVLEAESAAERVKAERVAALIEAAGGVESVGRMCRGARIYRGQWFAVSNHYDELVRQRAEVAAADERLAAARASGLAALSDEAKKNLDASKKILARLEGELDATLRADQKDLIRQAAQGAEHPRACLQSLAEGVPTAFPAGFAADLAAAVVDRPSPVEILLRLEAWAAE